MTKPDITKREFRSSEGHRVGLSQELGGPRINEAFALCMEIPSEPPAFIPGVPYDTVCAHVLMRLIGKRQLLNEMIQLTSKPGNITEPGENPGDRPMYSDRIKEQFPEIKITEKPKK